MNCCRKKLPWECWICFVLYIL